MNSQELNGHICRICLDANVVLNWNSTLFESYGVTYKDCYYKYTLLEYLADDPFSPMLCENCLNVLENIHTLVLKALESHKFFAETWLINSQCDDAITIDDDDEAGERITAKSISKINEKVISKVDVKILPTKFETVLIDDIEIDGITEKCNDVEYVEDLNDTVKQRNPSKKYIEQRYGKTKNKMKNPVVIPEDNFVLLMNSFSTHTPSKENVKYKQNNITEGNINSMYSVKNSGIKDNKKKIENKSSLLDLKDRLSEKDTRNKNYKGTEDSRVCSICSKVSSSIRAAKLHEKTHIRNRERNETCHVCGLKFFNRANLYSHKKIHNVNREKTHKCEYCDKAFYNSGELNIHRRKHLGQMIPCKLCPKEYFRQVDLDKHMNSHYNTKIRTKYFVRCKHCDKSILSTNFKSHTAAHLNTPLMKCTICNKEFFNRSSCVQHVKNFHGKTSEEYKDFIELYTKNRLSHLFLRQNAEIQLHDQE